MRAGSAVAEGDPRRARRERGEGAQEALGLRRAGAAKRGRGSGRAARKRRKRRHRRRAGERVQGRGGGEGGREGVAGGGGEGAREGGRGEAEGEEAAGLRDWVTGRLPGPGGSAANSQAALKE